jgi:hypothetical protein
VSCFSIVQIPALWLSGYSDRLEIYFLREQEFESLRRRSFALHAVSIPLFCSHGREIGGGVSKRRCGIERVRFDEFSLFRSLHHKLFGLGTFDSVKRILYSAVAFEFTRCVLCSFELRDIR